MCRRRDKSSEWPLLIRLLSRQLAGAFLADLKMPGVLPVARSALVLLLAAVIASVIPAAQAARIDVIQALRTE